MSSFKRRTPSTAPLAPAGTRQNSATSSVREMSTGIPSLDDILGGGQPLGSVLVVLSPDPHSAWGELVQRHWIAQGLAVGQGVVVVEGTQERGRDLVGGCMWVKEEDLGKDGALEDEKEGRDKDEVGVEGDKVKIAWRYEGMKRFETSVPAARASSSEGDVYSTQLDLTTKIPKSVVDKAFDTGQLHIVETCQPPPNLPSPSPCKRVLTKLSELIKGANHSEATEGSAVARPHAMRVAIPDLGGSYWSDSTPYELLRFLYTLRSIVQSLPVAVLVTLPSNLSVASPTIGPKVREEGWIAKLGFTCDGCIGFEGFGADASLSGTFPNYHGFIRVHKTPSTHSLVPPSHKLSVLRGLASPSGMSGGGGENNLGFRCTRRRFVIETLHLDVEGGVSERRTAPPVSGMTAHEETQLRVAKEHGAAAIQLESPSAGPVTSSSSEPSLVLSEKKKVRKAVAFTSSKSELYDF